MHTAIDVAWLIEASFIMTVIINMATIICLLMLILYFYFLRRAIMAAESIKSVMSANIGDNIGTFANAWPSVELLLRSSRRQWHFILYSGDSQMRKHAVSRAIVVAFTPNEIASLDFISLIIAYTTKYTIRYIEISAFRAALRNLLY